MPCVLWVSCDQPSSDLVALLELQPYKIIERGSVVETAQGTKKYEQTLCGFDVSRQDFTDLKPQLEEAAGWLEQHFQQLQRLQNINSTQTLDFGFYTEFADSKIVAQYNKLPHRLLKLAGDLMVDIELSQYWYSGEQGAQLN